MSENGWVKIYRKITDWEWWTQPSVAHLYIYLLLTANHKDEKWKGMLIKRGQMVTSRVILADSNGLSRYTVSDCLKELEKTGEIKVDDHHRYIIVTVCKYDDYQNGNDSDFGVENRSDNEKDLTFGVENRSDNEKDLTFGVENRSDNEKDLTFGVENRSDKSVKKNFGVGFCVENRSDNKQEFKNYNSHTQARTRESSGFDKNTERGFWRAVASDREYEDGVCRNLGIDAESLRALLQIFAREMKDRQKGHADVADYKDHFFCWLRRQVENPRSTARKRGGKPGLSVKEQRLRERNRQIEERLKAEEAKKHEDAAPAMSFEEWRKTRKK